MVLIRSPEMASDRSDLSRVLAYVAPHWRRLVPVLLLSLTGTVLSLFIPYLSKLLVDSALLGRDVGALTRINRTLRGHHGGFLRHERGQRSTLYPGVRRHPVRHAAGALSAPPEVVSAFLRRDHSGRDRVTDQQRHQRDPARGLRNGPRLVGQRDLPDRDGGDVDVARRPPVSGEPDHDAPQPVGPGALPPQARGQRGRSSAEKRRHRNVF